MKSKRLFPYLLGVALLLIIFAIVGKKSGWFGKPETIDVVVEQPAYRTLIESITANGKIEPVIEVKMSPEVSGEIIELPVIEGQQVTKGQLLCRIKPDTYISIRERAEASVSSAKARLTLAKAQLKQSELAYNRNKQLYEQNAISQSEFESAETNYQVAQADADAAVFNVNSAEASLKEAEENLAKTTIYAPMAGTISRLNVELGERVVGTAQMAGTEILRIADLTRMEARVSVNENDIVRVKLNDTSLVYVDAYPDEDFKGLVTQIANSAKVEGIASDQVTTFEVRIQLLAQSYAHLTNNTAGNPFRPGMSTTVDIQTTTRYQVLSVPIQAVTTRSDSVSLQAKSVQKIEGSNEHTGVAEGIRLKEVVFVATGDTARMVYVKPGIQDSKYIEILEGLSDSVDVIVSPFSAVSRRLSDGKLIKKVNADHLFSSK